MKVKIVDNKLDGEVCLGLHKNEMHHMHDKRHKLFINSSPPLHTSTSHYNVKKNTSLKDIKMISTQHSSNNGKN